MHAPANVCSPETSVVRQFSPAFPWVLGIELSLRA